MFFFLLELRAFFAEFQKTSNLEKLSNIAEGSFFEKKKRFHPFKLLKGTLSKTGGRRICRCWPAVL